MKRFITKKLIFTVIAILAIAVFLFCIFYDNVIQNQNFEISSTFIELNGEKIRVVVADNELERAQGLGGRETLAEDEGMLFIFPDKKIRKFWMKDMNFSIDILWIDDNRIVGVAKNLLPDDRDEREIYSSPIPVNHVLELSAGYYDAHGLEIGNIINIEL